MTKDKNIPKTLSSLFASLAFIVIGSLVFFNIMPSSLSDILHVLKISGLGAVIFGIIGLILGKALAIGKDYYDNNRGKFSEKDKELLIDDLLAYDIGVRHKPLTKDADDIKELEDKNE